MAVDAWWSWQWLSKPGSRKPPIGVWARSGGRYMRWRAAAIVMINIVALLATFSLLHYCDDGCNAPRPGIT